MFVAEYHESEKDVKLRVQLRTYKILDSTEAFMKYTNTSRCGMTDIVNTSTVCYLLHQLFRDAR